MVIYAIDDEKNALEYIIRKIKSAEPDAEVYGFNSATAAIESAKDLKFDVAFINNHFIPAPLFLHFTISLLY